MVSDLEVVPQGQAASEEAAALVPEALVHPQEEAPVDRPLEEQGSNPACRHLDSQKRHG